jgi:putative ABC transport system ATP-binding protein
MILQIENLSKDYVQGDRQVHVLKGLQLEIQEGESVAIVGPSGSGKSTLLGLLAGLDLPTQGTLKIKGQDLSLLNQSNLAIFRSQNIGIVFQQFHLLPNLTALENVMLPLQIQRTSLSAEKEARHLLNEVGLAHRLDHFPSEMSGGENQRVAIARALVTKPAIVLADEPSGNLDESTSDSVMNLLFDLVAKHKSTLLLVTHNLELAKRCDRSLMLRGGKFE